MRRLCNFGIFLSLLLSTFAYSKPFKVVFLNIAMKDDVWWINAGKIMQAACNDLDCKFTQYWAERDRNKMIQQLKEALSGSDKPDVAFFQSLKENGPQLLQLCEDAKVHAFIFNAGFVDKLKKQYGGPREKFKYWLGQMLPNDERAGYDVAKTLFKIARSKGAVGPDKKINVIGLEGNVSDFASIERVKGLKKAAGEEKDVVLHQVISAFWDREKAKGSVPDMLKRYPNTNAVWAANDPMALGAIDVIPASTRKLNKDIVVGSVDWIPEALESIKKDELSVSVGGHFMEAAWVIVLMADYYNGVDFAKTEGVDMQSQMGTLTKENVELYSKNLGSGTNWEAIDFKRFSKHYNKSVKKYDFTMDNVLKQFKK
ncbi:MAG: ABC transporter substrate-binding protein [Oligoflexales bacterium]|nr:ABC transporter substrate-binding protein [Oligoflexales bacterium]